MIIKLCLNGEIHRVSSLPDTFEALMTYAIRVFKDKMPEVFTFQYPDSDGDMVMLVNDESYKTMLDTEGSVASIKVFIVQPGETMSQSSMFRSAMIRSKLPESEGLNLNEPGVKKEIQKPVLEEPKPEPSEQNQILEREQAQHPRIEDSKNEKQDREPIANNDVHNNNPYNQGPVQAEAKKPEEPQVDLAAMEKSRLRDMAIQRLQNLKNKSAVRIQKNFRGYATRNELKKFAESILQETSHHNPKRKDLIDHPEKILQHKSEVIYPEIPIIQNLQDKIDHPHSHSHGVHTDVSVIKGALREVFLENVETLTKLLKHEPREVVQESVDQDLLSIVKDIVKTYNSLNPFLKEKIDEQFKGGIDKLSKHYAKSYENKIQPAPKPEVNKPEPPKLQDKEESKIDVTDKYNFQFVKEIGTLPKIITSKDTTVYKTVMIRNNGSADWPKGTVFTCLEGLKATECKLSTVNVGKEYTAVLAITNPGTSGVHESKWRASFVDDKGKKVYFGSPVTIELVVDGQGNDGNKKSYSESVIKKAKQMHGVLGVEEKPLQEFVSKFSNLSVDDLIDKYLSGNYK
jgi:hypothetical protein